MRLKIGESGDGAVGSRTVSFTQRYGAIASMPQDRIARARQQCNRK
jgi:hypothetical protein